jgi:hypothetical protein
MSIVPRLSCVALVWLFVASLAPAKTLYEDTFASGKLDRYLLAGAHAKEVSIKKTNPPEFGPNVLDMPELPHVDNTLAVVKGLEFKNGIIEVLWRDTALPEDADGPLFFRGQLADPNNAATAFQNCYLVELDTDTGLHVAIIAGGNENIPPAFTAAPRSTGEWTWIKVRADGPAIKVKSWLAKEKEPSAWNIESEDKTYASGVVGLRSWSGTAQVAYLAVADLDGPSPRAVSSVGKASLTWGDLKRVGALGMF